ncbi:MAG: glycosyltransferase family 2 protein [Janthinobacterium lividum]
MTASPTHLVLIPSYNTGARLIETVREATTQWSSVWVVIDGSTDGSERLLHDQAARFPGLRVLVLDHNRGKGAAILHGLKLAAVSGFTHVLTMDADGQHPPGHIGRFMAASRADPAAMILGRPVFDAHAPQLRVQGRRISNWWANFETPGCMIGDSLFGFRVYPIADLVAVMHTTRWMRRFDFEPEAAVRLCWRGVRCINLPAPVRYLRADEGGISHFHYGRDNLLLAWMHVRLVRGALLRVMRRRLRDSETH